MRRIVLALLLLAWPANAQTPVTVTGPITVGDCAQFASVTIIKDAGVTCGGGGGGGGIVVGTTTVTGGGVTNGQFLFNNAGVVGASTLGTMSTQNASAVAITGGTITGLGLPSIAADAANKQYVDNSIVGLIIHSQALLATTTTLPTNTYNNGASGVGATLTGNSNGALTIDSVLTTTSARIVVKNEAAPANNGIYVVTTVGDGSNPYVLTRATDANTPGTANPAEIGFGTYVFVTSGTVNADTGWSVNSTVTTIGTSAINWAQFSVSAGVGAVSSVANSDSSLTISPTFGNVVASINTAHSNIWTGAQTFTGTNGVVLLNTPSTAQTAQAVFSSAGTIKWQTGLYTDNSYFIFDSAASRFDLTTASNGNMSLMPSAGQISVGAATSPAPSVIEFDVNGLLRGYSVANDAGVYIGSQAAGTGYIQAVNNAAAAALPMKLQPFGSAITVGAPSGGALGAGTINAQGLYVNGVAVGGQNGLPFIEAYGGVGDGTTDNTAAFNAAIAAAVHTGRLGVQFGPGVFFFASSLAVTIPSSPVDSALSLLGSGSGVSSLLFASTKGMTITYNSESNTVHVRGLTFNTQGAASANAIHLVSNFTQSGTLGDDFLNDFYDVVFNSLNGSNYWAVAILNDGILNINFTNVTFTGPGTAGEGFDVEPYPNPTCGFGLCTSVPFGFIFNGCQFNNLLVGTRFSNGIQGVTITNTSYVTGGNTYGIVIDGANPFSSIAVTNSGFNMEHGIFFNSPNTSTVALTGNLFLVQANGFGIQSNGVNVDGISVIGNHFDSLGSNTAGVAFSSPTTDAIITGNSFGGLATAVWLQTGTTGFNVQANGYFGNGTNVLNSGPGNSVGVATQ